MRECLIHQRFRSARLRPPLVLFPFPLCGSGRSGRWPFLFSVETRSGSFCKLSSRRPENSTACTRLGDFGPICNPRQRLRAGELPVGLALHGFLAPTYFSCFSHGCGLKCTAAWRRRSVSPRCPGHSPLIITVAMATDMAAFGDTNALCRLRWVWQRRKAMAMHSRRVGRRRRAHQCGVFRLMACPSIRCVQAAEHDS